VDNVAGSFYLSTKKRRCAKDFAVWISIERLFVGVVNVISPTLEVYRVLVALIFV